MSLPQHTGLSDTPDPEVPDAASTDAAAPEPISPDAVEREAPFPGPLPPKKNGSKQLVAALLVLPLLAVAAATGVGFGTGWRFAPDTGAFEAGPVFLNGGTVPVPAADAPDDEILAFIDDQIAVALEAKGDAILSGDLDAWLAVFDPTLHASMTQRFDVLSAMDVSMFDIRVVKGPVARQSAVTFYETGLLLSYCLGAPADDCSPMGVKHDATWRFDGTSMRMVEVEISESGDGPHPWEVDELVAAAGERTVVVAPASRADRIDEVLRQAEEAAAVADAWARWGKPDRYLVYLGGQQHVDGWFGEGWPGEHVHGYAMPLTAYDERGSSSPSAYVTVIATDRTGWGDGLESILRHEMGHVATLWNAERGGGAVATWWMVEGIAEYIDHGGRPLEDYDRRWDVERHVRGGGCADAIMPIMESDDITAASGKYGCAFLGVHYMIETYGEDAFAEWFERAARNGNSPANSAERLFGKTYAELQREMTDFIASTV